MKSNINANNAHPNQIDAAQQQWDLQNQKYIDRYGKDVVYDQDYLKVKRDVLNQIYQQFKNDKSLTMAEKMDLRVMKGQVNQLDRRLYSRFTRGIRAVVNIFKSILKGLIFLPLQIGSMMAFQRPLPNNNALTKHRFPVAQQPISALERRAANGQMNGFSHAQELADGRSSKLRNGPESTPGHVVQRNFRSRVRTVLDNEKGQSKRL